MDLAGFSCHNFIQYPNAGIICSIDIEDKRGLWLKDAVQAQEKGDAVRTTAAELFLPVVTFHFLF